MSIPIGSTFASWTPESRVKYMLGICFPLRILLAFVVGKLCIQYPIVGVILFPFIGAMYLFRDATSSQEVWWNRKMHAGFMFIAAMAPNTAVTFILLLDTFFGIGSAFRVWAPVFSGASDSVQ